MRLSRPWTRSISRSPSERLRRCKKKRPGTVPQHAVHDAQDTPELQDHAGSLRRCHVPGRALSRLRMSCAVWDPGAPAHMHAPRLVSSLPRQRFRVPFPAFSLLWNTRKHFRVAFSLAFERSAFGSCLLRCPPKSVFGVALSYVTSGESRRGAMGVLEGGGGFGFVFNPNPNPR